jgi:outer membrane biosynthesis protein TonB
MSQGAVRYECWLGAEFTLGRSTAVPYGLGKLSRGPIARDSRRVKLVEERGKAGACGFHAMRSVRKTGISYLGALFLLLTAGTARGASDQPGSATQLSAAVCPIVYPLDRSPSEKGFHYIFYGNGFFINKEGYLITAAHVLSRLHGVPPYLLLQLPMAPPRMVRAILVSVDPDHDVAVLRATPNPFEGKFLVNYLRLATRRPKEGREVLADAVRPSRLKNPYTFDALGEDRPAGEVLEYRFTQLDRGREDTEIFLFNHDVLLGDSGAPVVSGETQDVVGLVEGRWLHGGAAAKASAVQTQTGSVGAAVPIHYAIALLSEKGIAWESAAEELGPRDPGAAHGNGNSAPTPLSLVAAPYPGQVFSGGEVVLDGLVESSGMLGDVRMVSGENPFAEKALAAVQTWSFRPARSGEKVVEARIGIVFQFPGSLTSTRAPQGHSYAERWADAPERGAEPLISPEADSSLTKMGEGSVILCEQVDAQGQVGSIDVVRGPESLTAATVAAARQWRFAPGRQGGVDWDSEVIVVVTYRRSVAAVPAARSKPHD